MNLAAAYAQVLSYAGALENPLVMEVTNTKLIRVHTNFTNLAKVVHEIPLAQIDDHANLSKLNFLFTQADLLRPGKTIAGVTEEAARSI